MKNPPVIKTFYLFLEKPIIQHGNLLNYGSSRFRIELNGTGGGRGD